MRTVYIITLLLFSMLFSFEANAAFGKKSADEQRAEILEIHDETLARLYREKPETEDQVAEAVGYAVFSNTGVNLLLVSTANGKGVAHHNSTGKDVFMNMVSAGGGIGLGLKKFSAVFIFHSSEAFDQFVIEGWNFTGQADAAATTDKNDQQQPGSMETAVGLNKGVTVYQMTEKGLALQVTLQGTKYWQDDDLN